ncbi:hypothetical protein DFP98_114122 [Cohnella phaseoli]|uniref:Uncharacterized protein n=1 Tax=Cohnella phaseoli TaxID=456490 RepID=A0A3D9JNS8_9BACL|nr:hypothetical protein DFP98_114122 [Cohnella phaseoli]
MDAVRHFLRGCFYDIIFHVQPPWVGNTYLQQEVMYMSFSLLEVIGLGMFLLALLTYLKRK